LTESFLSSSIWTNIAGGNGLGFSKAQSRQRWLQGQTIFDYQFWGKQVSENIIVSSWDPSTWKSSPAEEAVQTLFSYSHQEATNAVAWYEAAKRRKANASRWLRGSSIVLFVFGGLAPIVSGFMHGQGSADQTVFIGQCGYLMLGLAAGMLAFDRFFGMSSGWIRYMTSLGTLERLRAEFMFDWTVLLQKAPATIDDATRLLFLERAQTFQKAVLELIERETAAWVAEFQSSVADLDKAVQAQRQATEASIQAALKQQAEVRQQAKKEEQTAVADRGAINLEIDGDIEGTLEIFLDGDRVKETGARSTALLNLPRGPHSVAVKGIKAGKAVSAERAITVNPGAAVDLKLTPR
jgi:hypothetical protein